MGVTNKWATAVVKKYKNKYSGVKIVMRGKTYSVYDYGWYYCTLKNSLTGNYKYNVPIHWLPKVKENLVKKMLRGLFSW